MILIQKISEIIVKLISPLIIKRLSKMSLNEDIPKNLIGTLETYFILPLARGQFSSKS